MKFNQNFLLLASFFILISCDESRVFDEFKAINGSNWNKDNPVVFQVNLEDTVNPHNIFINLRHGGQYQFSNLFLFVTTTLPDGKMTRDTVELLLADKDGRWFGKGLGDLWTHNFPFYENFRFPQKGVYKISLIQAMRVQELASVSDVGLRIEKASD